MFCLEGIIGKSKKKEEFNYKNVVKGRHLNVQYRTVGGIRTAQQLQTRETPGVAAANHNAEMPLVILLQEFLLVCWNFCIVLS